VRTAMQKRLLKLR